LFAIDVLVALQCRSNTVHTVRIWSVFFELLYWELSDK